MPSKVLALVAGFKLVNRQAHPTQHLGEVVLLGVLVWGGHGNLAGAFSAQGKPPERPLTMGSHWLDLKKGIDSGRTESREVSTPQPMVQLLLLGFEKRTANGRPLANAFA